MVVSQHHLIAEATGRNGERFAVSTQSEASQFTDRSTDLRIYLLGPPGVEWAGCPLVIPRRQARALLYRLAVQLQPVPREHLCFLFWPDTPESTARRNLSHLLTHLRRALPAPEVLLDSDDQVGLDPQRAWSDVTAFERLCAALTSSPLHPPPPLPILGEGEGGRGGRGEGEVLQQAVNLYRGPFLAGFSLPDSPEFEAWATQERYAWERLYLEALATLIEERAARGEHDAAIAYARRYLETDDLAEDVHRRLIELYATAGHRSEALRQFERCAVILERELGVSPLPETRAVYQAILADQPPPRLVARPAWMTLPGLDVPLVGRDEVMRRLEQAYARAQAGQGGVVLISGEAGIGKSRLMQEFATHLEDQTLVLVGAGHPAAQTTPYQPIIQALRTVLSRGAEEQRSRGKDFAPAPLLPRSLAQIWLAEASRLLPELRDMYPDLPPPLPAEPDEARSRLFEALSQIILGLATSPLLLCLDDLHWADSATLDWLAYLGRHLQGSRLLIIGAYRSEETDALIELRHNLTRQGILSELKLAGLDKAAVLQLLRHLLVPILADEALAGRLQRATGGNPFFLLETLRVLIESGQPLEELVSSDDLPLPDTVRQAVEARLARLSPVARQVLESGTVLGTTFGFDLVRLTAGRRELETLDGLDELVARQLLLEQVPGYRFHHDLTQRVVQAGLSPMRCQLLHRRAGRALERLQPDAVAALARHFDAGGEVKKALHYHGLAAQQAEALFAWREAEERQSRMLVLLDRLDPECTQPDCLAQRGQVLAARADQRYFQGRLVERDADLAALATLAETSADEDLRLQALIHRARYLNLDAQYEKAIASAEEGLTVASRLNNLSGQCYLLNQIGFAHYFLGQPRQALTALESALAMTPEADFEMRRHITHTLGYVHFHLGNYARSLAYQQESYACHQTAGDYNGMAWAGLDIAATYLEMGHLAEARQHLTEHLNLARRIGARSAEAYGLSWLGCWELCWGNYIAAMECFQQALSTQQELRTEHGRVAAELGTGFACYHLGDLAGARHWLERAVERARPIGHRRRLVEALIGQGLVAIKAGQPSTAHRCLTEAVAVARDSECRRNLAAGLAALARAERESGDPVIALAHAREAIRVAQESALPVCEMWGEVEAGLVLLAQGEPVAALEHTGRAVALVPQAHQGWIGTEEVHRAHALVLRALGRVEEADEHAWRAEAIVAVKADRIPDPQQRHHYLQFAHSLTR